MTKEMRIKILLNEYREKIVAHTMMYDYPLISMILSDDLRTSSFVYHPRSSFDNQSIHAEIRTLKNFCAVEKIKKKQQKNQYIKKIELLVFRINAKGNFVMARPCRDCACAIYNSHIVKRVYYTNEKGEIESNTPAELLELSTPIIMQRLVDYYNGCKKTIKSKYINFSQRFKKVSSEKYNKSHIALMGARQRIH